MAASAALARAPESADTVAAAQSIRVSPLGPGPGDKMRQSAARAGAAVFPPSRMPPHARGVAIGLRVPARMLLRECDCEENPGAPSCEGCAERQLQRSGDGLRPSRVPSGGRVHPRITSAIDASRGGGRPLERGMRERLELGFGESFGDVRVHADAHAGALARAVSAHAFAVGPDLFFAAGAYRPGSPDGDKLIAHEVTHVIQQRSAPGSGPLNVSAPGDAAELEAEAMASTLQAEAGPPPPRESASPGGDKQARIGATQFIYGAATSIARRIDPTSDDQSASVAGMDLPARLVTSVTNAGKYVAPDLVDQLKQLITPEAIALEAGFLAAQLTGFGEVADAVGFGLLVAKIGTDAFQVAANLKDFFVLTVDASSGEDLDDAGKHLAHALTLIGVDALLVYLAAKKSEGEQDKDQGQDKDEVPDSTLESATVDSQPEPAEEPSTPADPAGQRVKLRISTKRAILEHAPNRLPNGDYYDPNSGEIIPKDGPFDFGHKPGFRWRETQARARAEGWTRKQLIEYENDPSHYQVEESGSNRSHFYEEP